MVMTLDCLFKYICNEERGGELVLLEGESSPHCIRTKYRYFLSTCTYTFDASHMILECRDGSRRTSKNGRACKKKKLFYM